MDVKKIPISCPACNEHLQVQMLNCVACGTAVSGTFKLPILMLLDRDEHDFLLRFVKSSGSLKEMAKQLGYSYPKVRNMLDDLIEKIEGIEKNRKDAD
ncbi:MAG: DUF2089 family protein [Saprospirales bacterium]|nr:MAG: DUF2089 family protein [Saprospirales bacterium]